MFRNVVAVVVVAFLAACATSEKYSKLLDTWVGSTESQLVAKWGPPDQVYQAPDGTRYLTYNESRLQQLPSTAGRLIPLPDGTYYQEPMQPGAVYTARCKTTFIIKNGKIASWRWEGNNCVAS